MIMKSISSLVIPLSLNSMFAALTAMSPAIVRYLKCDALIHLPPWPFSLHTCPLIVLVKHCYPTNRGGDILLT